LAFPLGREKSFRLELAFERFELRLEQPLASRLKELDTELILAARFKDREVAENLDLRTIAQGLPRQRHIRAAKDDAGDLGTLILEREILVTARMEFVVRNFALHPDRTKPCLEHAADGPRQFAYGEDFARTRKEVSC
jgi:hypothetical protein